MGFHFLAIVVSPLAYTPSLVNTEPRRALIKLQLPVAWNPRLLVWPKLAVGGLESRIARGQPPGLWSWGSRGGRSATVCP